MDISGADALLASLNLPGGEPGGRYLITAKAQIHVPSGGAPVLATCRLDLDGSEIDSSAAMAAPPAIATVPLMAAADLSAAGGTVTLVCTAGSESGLGYFATRAKLAAVEVSQLNPTP